MRAGFTYILTNKSRKVLYTGVTNNICRRLWEHRYHAPLTSFVGKYNVKHLIYFELHHTISEAISREKQIKSWKRERKVRLITVHNPEWKFLATFPEDKGLPKVEYPDYDDTLDRDL